MGPAEIITAVQRRRRCLAIYDQTDVEVTKSARRPHPVRGRKRRTSQTEP